MNKRVEDLQHQQQQQQQRYPIIDQQHWIDSDYGGTMKEDESNDKNRQFRGKNQTSVCGGDVRWMGWK